MEMRRTVRRRLLAAEAGVVVISFLVLCLCTDLASNGGSFSANMAPKVFHAKNSSYGYGSELHAWDSCGNPGTAQAGWWEYIGYQIEGSVCCFLMKKGIKEDRLISYTNETEYSKALSKGPTNDGGSAIVDENPYFRSDDRRKTVFSDKTPPLVHGVDDVILDIAFGYDAVEYFDTFECSMETAQRLEPCWSAQNKSFCEYTFPYSAWDPRQPPPWERPTALLKLTVPDMDVTTDEAHSDLKPPIQWMFLKPLTKELWLATVCFIFFTGFVFWMIERSINPEFQGSSLAQFSTALYFVFSTLTFSHGQILRSPLSKIVLVVWCFTVLVLVQSSVTNLSSMLAAEASANNGSSSVAGSAPAPLTLRSFSGLFVVTGCIDALMLLISLTRSAYAAYTRVRGSEPQNDAENGSVVPEQPVQEVRDNSAISGDEEAGTMSDASEPAPDVYMSRSIEMTSTSNAVGGAL